MMVRDNAIDHGKSHARTFAQFFGCKERLEDAVPDIIRHAEAGIRDPHHDFVRYAGWRWTRHAAGDVAPDEGFDDKVTAVRHRITGIKTQVHNDLLDLASVAFNDERGSGKVCEDLYLAVKGLRDDLQYIAYNIVDVDWLVQVLSFPCKAEQLLCQLGCPVGNMLDRVDRIIELVI